MSNDAKRRAPLGLSRKKRLVLLGLAIVCALSAVGLFAWQSRPVAEVGTSVTAADGKTRKQIQEELDASVRENMMTISVAPVVQINDDGTMRVNVRNVDGNKFPQRFRVIQDEQTIYESGVVEVGKTVETCPAEVPEGSLVLNAGDIAEGEASIEIQALDSKTFDEHGNPTRIKVQVAHA